MDNFPRAVEIILEREGVLSNDKFDPGGLTKYGISQKYHPEVNVAELTVDAAKLIYRQDYWNRVRCSELPWGLALMAFDSAVNQGVHFSVHALQLAVGTVPDGIMGGATVRASQKADVQKAVVAFKELRLTSYQESPNWGHFGRGWENRLNAVMMEAMTEPVQETEPVPEPEPTPPVRQRRSRFVEAANLGPGPESSEGEGVGQAPESV